MIHPVYRIVPEQASMAFSWLYSYQYMLATLYLKQEVKVIWQKVPYGGPIPRLGVTPGGRNLYHWVPGVGFPISVP